MGVSAGPDIIENGLVLALDASDRNSYVSGSTTWFDLSGNNNSGSLVNGPTFNTGSLGSIVFDGSNDYVTGSVLPLYNTDWTVEFWALSTGIITNWPTVFSQGGTNSLQFATCHGGSRKMAFWYSSGERFSNTSIPYNTWHNGVLQYRHSDGRVKFFLNGSSDSDWLNPINKYIQANTLQTIGYWVFPSAQNLNGRISNIKVYTRLLNDSEVLQNYNATKARFGL